MLKDQTVEIPDTQEQAQNLQQMTWVQAPLSKSFCILKRNLSSERAPKFTPLLIDDPAWNEPACKLNDANTLQEQSFFPL